jgi:hypothetical protein
MLLRLLFMLAYPLALMGELVIRTLRHGVAPLAARQPHPKGLHGFYSVVLHELEDFLDEKIDKLMAHVAEIEAHAEQFREIGYELTEVRLSGNPLPGVTLEFEPCGLSEDTAFQALLQQKQKSVTFRLIVKLLQHTSRYRRQYHFRNLTSQSVSIRLGKQPYVQILYQQIPKGMQPG